MGRLLPYQAAMHRVLKGLECVEAYDSESEHECDEDDCAAAKEARDNKLGRLASELRGATGAHLAPSSLKEKCTGPDGEFYVLKGEVVDRVCRYSERTNDWQPVDELEDDDAYNQALERAQERVTRGSLSVGELKSPKTLTMFILKVAHRRATRMRAASVMGP
jgi:hypothetical protein